MGLVYFWQFCRCINRKTCKQIIDNVSAANLFGLSSQIAYTTLLAIFPALLAILSSLQWLEDSLFSALTSLFVNYQELMPLEAWQLLQNVMKEVTTGGSPGLFSTSSIVALWLASGALITAMRALDQIAQVPIAQRRSFWQGRLIAMVITLGFIFLIVSASIVVLMGEELIKLMAQISLKLPLFESASTSFLVKLWRILNWPVAFVLIAIAINCIYEIVKSPRDFKHPLRKTILITITVAIGISLLIGLVSLWLFIKKLIFGLGNNPSIVGELITWWQWLSWPVGLLLIVTAYSFLYRVGPSVHQKDLPTIPGATISGLLWLILSSLFRAYVTNYGKYNQVYGALGAVIILMVWLQMSGFILLLGYEINRVIGTELNRRKASLTSSHD
jgi:membrane protein